MPIYHNVAFTLDLACHSLNTNKGRYRRMKETPRYIKSLLVPNGQKPVGRKVWGIDLELVWLPFFMATNLMGDTAISHEALGAPLRLGYYGDGTVKFNKSGRPQVKVVKELGDTIKTVRENFTATLSNYAGGVINSNPDDYKALVSAIKEAGEPIIQRDRLAMQEALKAQVEEAMAQAESKVAEPKTPEREPAQVTA